MGKIRILDESVSNMIAAGEVVENPASMIKELLENSLDAKSTQIQIDIKNDGRNVTISDNGIGMSKDDLLLCIERHATSKIRNKDDLYNLITYGFRGEALSSISAVSKTTLTSKSEDDTVGTLVTTNGGKVTQIKEIQRNRGTTIEIKDLFFNTPARLKFLRKTSTEYSNIKDIVIQEALANSNVAITLTLDGKVSLKTSGNGIDNTIVEIFGKNVLKNLKKFNLGFLGNGEIFRSTRDSIFIFVNNRMVKSKLIENALIEGYYTKLMKGRYPFAILFIEINPKEIDVNVHPSKKIIKFSDEDYIYNMVVDEVRKSFEKDEDFISPTITNKVERVEENKIESNLLDFSQFEKFIPIQTQPQKFVEFDESITENDSLFSDNKMENIIIEKTNNIIEERTPETISIKTTQETNFFKEKNYIKTKKEYDFKVIGQLFDMFILVERNGIFEIYDQHIVHERILYEKLKKQYYSDNTSMQQLLVPIRFLTDVKEMEIITSNEENLRKAGFEIDKFSEHEILIRAIPQLSFNDSIENIFRNVLNNIRQKRELDIRENIIISMSCKGAIKAHQKLQLDEMYTLISQLHEIGEYTCPHGRPIIVKITLDDLEKLFKRK